MNWALNKTVRDKAGTQYTVKKVTKEKVFLLGKENEIIEIHWKSFIKGWK